MRYFKNTWFERFAEKHSISDAELKAVIADLESGKIDVAYGSGLYKQRLARSGEGKSGGYRTLVVFKSEHRSFFVYGFEKSDKSNINKAEKTFYKQDAKKLLHLSDEQINEILKQGYFMEF